jgi:DnaK suppressor protein
LLIQIKAKKNKDLTAGAKTRYLFLNRKKQFYEQNFKMDANQLENYKKQLLEQRDRLVGQLNENQRQSFEFGLEEMPDPVDAAVQDRSQTILLSISESERDLIDQIDESLQRIELGSYGICVNCERDIAVARIEAVPYARYCMNCQEKLERGELDEE